MDCSEFQKVLPYIIETGGNAEEEAHLRSCPVCSDLVQDLRYIAEQAKLLLPMRNPSPRVWSGIRNALQQEGLVRPPAGTARFRAQEAAVLTQRRLGSSGWLLALAALLLLAISIVWFRSNGLRQSEMAVVSSPAVSAQAPADEEDAKVLDLVQQRAPAMLGTYRENMDSVNAYIRDAKRSVEENPNDEEAHDQLIRACDQKTLLYEMALSHTAE